MISSDPRSMLRSTQNQILSLHFIDVRTKALKVDVGGKMIYLRSNNFQMANSELEARH